MDDKMLKEISKELACNTFNEGEVYLYLVEKLGVKPKKRKKSLTPTNELFDYWLARYNEIYGVPYQVSNFAKEKAHVRQLSVRYGNDVDIVKAIMDVAIRLYDSRWKSANFIRPTLGALVSWLAAQAEPFARANVQNDPEIVITTDDGIDIFDVYDKAWGIDNNG